MASTATTEAFTYLSTRLSHTHPPPSHSPPFTIPIIDLASSSRSETAKQIHAACTTTGFFYITSHGISPHTTASILAHSKKFFHNLSVASKQTIHIENSAYGYGWEPSNATRINYGYERKEAFNWGYEADMDVEAPEGRKHVQLDGELTSNVNQWPSDSDLPGFREGVKEYYSQALQLARSLCKLFALSLDLSDDYFDGMVRDPSANGRLMYYPSSSTSTTSADQGEDIGLGAHSDYQCFTILLCDSTPGLEILSPTGEWVQAEAVQGALIVNIGDMMMRWTNGVYKSTVHRVLSPSEGAGERFSVPLFFGVGNDQIVKTLPSCVSEERPLTYMPIKAGEYILERLAATRV